MLLETLDIRKNDVLIYSQNKFDFENNFKIIFKRESKKRAKKISYFEVCEFVKDTTPKNLIVYRLLTNVKGLDAFSTKYGYFVKINNNMELIYFDPVFALKDLKHLKFRLEPEEFRFKIQQVGLTSLSHDETEAVYSEVYNFDMRAEEARNQNDKIFADAIFIFDDTYSEDDEIDQAPTESTKKQNKSIKDEPVLRLKTVIDEKDIDQVDISKVNLAKEEKISSVREEKINLLKKALGISEDDKKGQYRENKNVGGLNNSNNKFDNASTEIKNEKSLIDLFKSTGSIDFLNNRRDESYILKIDD